MAGRPAAALALALAFSSLPAAVRAALPVDSAVAEAVKLKKLHAFTEALYDYYLGHGLDDCKAAAETFATQCSGVQETTCKKCSVDPSLNETACSGQDPAGWMEDKDSLCCNDGRVECANDANGEELSYTAFGRCCAFCNNQTSPHSSFCNVAQLRSTMLVSICGTAKPECYQCTSQGLEFEAHSEGDCTRYGLCTGQGATAGCQASDCCPASATFTPAVWSQVDGVTNEAQCKQHDACYKCAGPCEAHNYCPVDENSCKTSGVCTNGNQSSPSEAAYCSTTGVCTGATDQAGTWTPANQPWERTLCTSSNGTWTPATWTYNNWTKLDGLSEQDCYSTPGRMWSRRYYFKEGDTLPAPPMLPGQTCATGPDHLEPSHVIPSSVCMDHTRLLQDAADGLNVTAAVAANATYYRDLRRFMLGSAYVINHPDAVERAKITFSTQGGQTTMCFVAMLYAMNAGQVIFDGAPQTYALLVDPNSTQDSDPLLVQGAGTVVVLGGYSAGTILVNTSGTMEIYGVQNAGSVTILRAGSPIVIADVVNSAGAKVEATDAVVTFVNVVNEGTVRGLGSAGNYTAYNITNRGTINITAGTVELHLACNAGGTIVAAEGVTGTVSYDGASCRGAITVPPGVTTTNNAGGGSSGQPPAVPATMVGDLTIAGLTKAVAQTIEASIKTSLAHSLGADESTVTILGFEDARRRLGAISDSRRLSSTGVKVNYHVEVADATAGAALQAKVAQSATQSAFLTELKTLNSGSSEAATALASATVSFAAPQVMQASSSAMPVYIGAATVAAICLAVARA